MNSWAWTCFPSGGETSLVWQLPNRNRRTPHLLPGHSLPKCGNNCHAKMTHGWWVFFPTYITVTFLLVLVQFNPVLSIQVAGQWLARIGWNIFITMYIHNINPIWIGRGKVPMQQRETWSWDWGCCSPAVEPGARGQPGWFCLLKGSSTKKFSIA